MEVENLEQKLCKGVKDSEDGFRKVEKVLAPFLRTLKKRNHEKADVLATDYEELYLKKNNKELLARLQDGFGDPLTMRTLLNETAELLKVVTKSKSVNLYITDYSCGELLLCPKYYPLNLRLQRKYTIGTYVAAHVAFTKEYVISSDILGDVRFPQGIPDVPVVKSVICLPIMTNVEGNCIGVIELYRECSDRPYDLINLQICNALTAWMGIALEQNDARLNLIKEMEIHKQLSVLSDLYFSGVAPFNKIVSDFLVPKTPLLRFLFKLLTTSAFQCQQKVAKVAVNADRGAFYVFREPVPPRTEDTLWADAYEEGCDENNETVLYKKRDRIRFVKNKPGIPGYAARTGEVVNIQDAYKDYRFDKNTDSPFYRTRSVLSFPIKNDSGVMGVLNLINSQSHPYFRAEDITLIQSFSCYLTLICGYFFLENSHNKMKLRLVVTDKLLDFHTKPSAEDLNNFKLLVHTDQSFPPGFFKFEWESTGYEDEAHRHIVTAFLHSEFLDPSIEVPHFLDFLLRIKKAHRPVMYHNFDHAMNVFHFAFNIIVRNKDTYNSIETLTVLLASISHDVDHMGFTNGFLTLKNDSIYKLYGEYCGEAHRFELVLFLIQQTDLLSNFSEQHFQLVTKNLRRLMLAFDLALHFQNRQKLIGLLNSRSFSWEDPEHRFLSQNAILLCSDHSVHFKSFEIVRKYVSQLYKELHKQGDLEKSMGFSPLPMLDRNKADMASENQSIYLTMVVMPCVHALIELFPNLAILEDLLNGTITKWEELITLRGRQIWKISQALLKEKKDRRLGHRVTLASTVSSLRTILSDTKTDTL